jgi:hypothetical protein
MIIYQTQDGLTKIDVAFDDDTVWLSLDQMAQLFQRDKSVISRHIKNIYILDIKICVVPGNHDIDYLKGDRGASGLANIEDHRSYDKHISEELEKQEQFYILARRYNCFKQSGLVDKREFIHKNSLKINIFPLSGWRSFIRFAT